MEKKILNLLPDFVQHVGSLHKTDDYYFFIIDIPEGEVFKTSNEFEMVSVANDSRGVFATLKIGADYLEHLTDRE